MQKLDAGVYLDLDCIHFDREELCASYRVEPTPRNMRRLGIAWLLDWLEYQHRPQSLFDLS
jgi:hypothetical protein